MDNKPKCRDCYYFATRKDLLNDNHYHECRYNPPVVTYSKNEYGGTWRSDFPRVNCDDWCGKFVQNIFSFEDEEIIINDRQVKELRDKTGMGMKFCAEALIQTKGDIDKAIEVMKKP